MTRYEKLIHISDLCVNESKVKTDIFKKMYLRIAEYFKNEANNLTLSESCEVIK